MRLSLAAVVLVGFVLTSGCLAFGEKTSVPIAAAASSGGPPQPTTDDASITAFSYDGTTDTQVCSFVANCFQVDPGHNIEYGLGLGGGETSMRATATMPTGNAHQVSFFLIVERPDGGRGWDSSTRIFSSSQAVDIEWDLSPYDGLQTWVRASSLRIVVAPPVDFHMNGGVERL